MAVATDKASQKTELTQEQLNEFRADLKGLEKKFSLSASDLAYQAIAHGFNNYLDLVGAAAKHQTGISDNKDATLVAKKAEIATACGLAADTKRNIISPKDLTDASINLWKNYGDDIRTFFASLKK